MKVPVTLKSQPMCLNYLSTVYSIDVKLLLPRLFFVNLK